VIFETVITTVDRGGDVHIAPMGIRVENDYTVIAPFRPSTTLENLRCTGQAVVNLTDDVRIIAGCLTGRRNWPVTEAEKVRGKVLLASLSHAELVVAKTEEDGLRPRFHCSTVHVVSHAPFRGFNRAQAAVIEAAILVSRLDRLPAEKIRRELAYLQIAIDKTAGEREHTAWHWLMERLNLHRQETGQQVLS